MDPDEAQYLAHLEARIVQLKAALSEAITIARTSYLDEDDIYRLNELETLLQ